MARPLTAWMQGLLKTSYLSPPSVLNACFSRQSNPEEWDALSGDLLAIHSRREKDKPVSKKRSIRRPTLKAAEQRPSKEQTSKPGLGAEHVFGLHPVLLALRARKRILYELHVDAGKLSSAGRLEQNPLLLQILDLAKEQELPVNGCPQSRLEQLCRGANHQGVCLDTSRLPVLQGETLLGSLDDSDIRDKPGRLLWLYMDRILDPMNFGAVLRSSCYFGVQKIFMPSKDSCRLSPTVSKASSGALELMDLYVLQTPEQFVTELKAKGWWIVGTSSFNDSTRHASGTESRKLTWDLPPPDKPALLIVGNEGEGVQQELSALCDSILCVAPLEKDSPIGSLNVSVATGIVLHHLSLAEQS
ncbi:rRNA methyltransferase 1, mitochondrial-like isoform X1 [Dermacentor albipictus]|uniref:rRNA methyltransferase 1, mitochondrial-like isoform X1 n=2 Tax=Dermacentor albipictus TaxID=60249 RepID=UPI0031FC44DC